MRQRHPSGLARHKERTLLARAEQEGFDVLITLDDDIEGEQNMAGRRIALLVLKPRKQGKAAARELAGKILAVLPALQPGEIRVVSLEGGPS